MHRVTRDLSGTVNSHDGLVPNFYFRCAPSPIVIQLTITGMGGKKVKRQNGVAFPCETRSLRSRGVLSLTGGKQEEKKVNDLTMQMAIQRHGAMLSDGVTIATSTTVITFEMHSRGRLWAGREQDAR